jgi:three-Cys-motif partner protein
MARAWGIWTKSKLDLLKDYLDAFTTATKIKSPKERIYLDLFGGEPENVDRTTLSPIDGSARIALDTTNPPFTRLRFFELPQNAAKLRTTLQQEFPGRDLRVYEGDCNDSIHEALADLHRDDVAWAPTFAFIDPNGPDCHWATLEALAAHKGPEAKTKVELWMLFPVPLFQRMLPRTGAVRQEDEERITLMYGTPAWHAVLAAKLDGEISATEAREEYVNLMRWRLEQELGYSWTHHLMVNNESNRPIYYMVFATDSDPGKKIMRDLYEKAAVTFPKMIEQNRAIRERMERESQGVMDLFSSAGIEVPSAELASPGRIRLPDDPPEAPREHDPQKCRFCTSDALWSQVPDEDQVTEDYLLDEDF